MCSLTVEYSSAGLISCCLVGHWLKIGPPKLLDILWDLLSTGDFKLLRPQITTVKKVQKIYQQVVTGEGGIEGRGKSFI